MPRSPFVRSSLSPAQFGALSRDEERAERIFISGMHGVPDSGPSPIDLAITEVWEGPGSVPRKQEIEDTYERLWVAAEDDSVEAARTKTVRPHHLN